MRSFVVPLLISMSLTSSAHAIFGICVKSTWPFVEKVRPVQLVTLQADQAQKIVDKVEASRGGDLVAISFQDISNESIEFVERMIQAQLELPGSQPYVRFSARSTNVEERNKGLHSLLKIAFPDVVKDYDARHTGNVNLSEAFEDIAAIPEFNEQNPATIFITDFVPTSETFEPFSSLIRALYNQRAMNDDLYNLRFIMTSRYPTYEWGSAQGGMNVGEHVNASSLASLPD